MKCTSIRFLFLSSIVLLISSCIGAPTHTDVIRFHQDGKTFPLHNHTFEVSASQDSLVLYLSGIYRENSFHVGVLEFDKKTDPDFIANVNTSAYDIDFPNIVKTTIVFNKTPHQDRLARLRAVGDGEPYSFIKADFTIHQSGTAEN